jgi:toxin ParE1/3/4
MIHLSQEARSDIERVREFLGANNPEAAKRALLTIFAALEQLEEFPGLGRPTEDPAIRQLIIPFGARGYVVRYTVRSSGDVLVLRLWHGREARPTDDT